MKYKKIICALVMVLLLCAALCGSAFAASGSSTDVSAVVEQTWTAAVGQIKNVVNKVVFPTLDLILAVTFFGKMALSFFDCAPAAAIA